MAIWPTRIDHSDYDKADFLDDIESLRPKPEKDCLLIVGDATGVWDDVEEFFKFGIPHDTMLINHVATVWPWPFEHFVAGDSHMIPMQDIAKGLSSTVIKHCWNPTSEGFDIRWIRGSGGWQGTTANLAVKIGIALDYLKMVLAGIPMDFSGHWYNDALPEDDVKRSSDHRAHLQKWIELANRPVARFIRSMSGNTAELFGKPTKEWLTPYPEVNRG